MIYTYSVIRAVMPGVQVWAAYSPVKNSPPDAKAKAAAGSPSHSATTGELDIYQTNCRCAAVTGLTMVTERCSAPGLD